MQEHFPEARGVATPEVVGRARFEATNPGLSACWKASFPGELPQGPVLPEPLERAEFELEGNVLRAVSVGWGDTKHSTVLHVPSAAAVIGGDVVYNGVHMLTAETDEKTREAWIASLDAVTALSPEIVVAGHKRVGAPGLPERASAPASGTCATSAASSAKAAPWKTSWPRCSNCTPIATTRGPCGTPPVSPSRNAGSRLAAWGHDSAMAMTVLAKHGRADPSKPRSSVALRWTPRWHRPSRVA